MPNKLNQMQSALVAVSEVIFGIPHTFERTGDPSSYPAKGKWKSKQSNDSSDEAYDGLLGPAIMVVRGSVKGPRCCREAKGLKWE